MMFCFKSILQIWIIFDGFRDINDFVNVGICKHDFKFTSWNFLSSSTHLRLDWKKTNDNL